MCKTITMSNKLKYIVLVLLSVPFMMLTSCKSDVDKYFDLEDELMEVLAEIKDRESADDAAVELNELVDEMLKLPSLDRLKLDMKPDELFRLNSNELRAGQEGLRIGMNAFYGSYKLQLVFERMARLGGQM